VVVVLWKKAKKVMQMHALGPFIITQMKNHDPCLFRRKEPHIRACFQLPCSLFFYLLVYFCVFSLLVGWNLTCINKTINADSVDAIGSFCKRYTRTNGISFCFAFGVGFMSLLYCFSFPFSLPSSSVAFLTSHLLLLLFSGSAYAKRRCSLKAWG